MLEGSCHCGSVRWEFDGEPEDATICNCTVCRRYGVLWAYDYEDEGIRVFGPTKAYRRGKAIDFHFCPDCACVICWRLQPDYLAQKPEARRRTAVNLRLAEPDSVAGIPIRRFDGLHSFEDLPSEGRCVTHYWF